MREMGYGHGNVGTGMHLIPNFRRGAKRTKKNLEAMVNHSDEMSDCVTDMVTEEDRKIYTGGDPFDCSENLTASIIAKLSGVPVEKIYADTLYAIRGVENFTCKGWYDDKCDWWQLLLPIVYKTNDHGRLGASSIFFAYGSVDCDFIVDNSDDPELKEMCVEWFGPRHLLSGITGLVHVHEIETTCDNVVLRPSPWLFDAMDKYTTMAFMCYSEERVRYANQCRLDFLVNIILDVTKSLYKRLKDDGCTIYKSTEVPLGCKICNLPDDDEGTKGVTTN